MSKRFGGLLLVLLFGVVAIGCKGKTEESPQHTEVPVHMEETETATEVPTGIEGHATEVATEIEGHAAEVVTEIKEHATEVKEDIHEATAPVEPVAHPIEKH